MSCSGVVLFAFDLYNNYNTVGDKGCVVFRPLVVCLSMYYVSVRVCMCMQSSCYM